MKWMEIWMKIFGRSEWLGLNMGFWVSLCFVTLLVLVMNIVFWTMKPKVLEEVEGAKEEAL